MALSDAGMIQGAFGNLQQQMPQVMQLHEQGRSLSPFEKYLAEVVQGRMSAQEASVRARMEIQGAGAPQPGGPPPPQAQMPQVQQPPQSLSSPLQGPPSPFGKPMGPELQGPPGLRATALQPTPMEQQMGRLRRCSNRRLCRHRYSSLRRSALSSRCPRLAKSSTR